VTHTACQPARALARLTINPVGIIIGSVLASLLVARPGVAQSVRVRVDAEEPSTVHELYREGQIVGQQQPIARCPGNCTFDIAPGRYRMRLLRPDSSSSSSRTFEVGGPSILHVQGPSSDEHWAGLILGVSGSVLFIGGFLALTPYIVSATCDTPGCKDPHQGEWAAVSFFSIGVGAVAAPIGWIMYAKSFKADVDVEPVWAGSPTSRRRGPTWSFAAAPVPGGGAVLAGAVF
jgi:hypothetical protein